MFQVGDTIGDYRIVSRLNEGGMATLFLGRRLDAGPGEPPVAIKAIHEMLSSDWQFARMFVDEALISVRIRHPNVVRVDELGEHEGTYFLAMEYVQGCSLAELLRAMGRKGRRMRPEIAVWIATQVAGGLHAAHEMTGHDGELLGVVHRDVSPQNVLLSLDGEVKLLDFGIAKAAGRAERTEAGVIKGKVRYMSPEQAQGEAVNRRVDIYALGVVLWEMLTMRRYIEGKNDIEIIKKVRNPEQIPPSQRAQGVDPAVDEAVMAALAPKAQDRPQTADGLRRMLEVAIPERRRVGRQHVAELLRVFVADEIAKNAATLLPADVATPMIEKAREGTPLPGETEPADERTRTMLLTTEAPESDYDSMSGKREGSPERVTKAPPTARKRDPDEAPKTVNEFPKFEDIASLDDADPTVKGDSALRDQMIEGRAAAARAGVSLTEHLRERMSAPSEELVPSTLSGPQRPVPSTAVHPAIIPTAAATKPSALRRVLRILVLTIVAFLIGAGAAVAYVRFLQ